MPGAPAVPRLAGMRAKSIGPRPTDRSELPDWYNQVLLEQERCGLSVADFAEEVGVSVPTLYAWRRRLRSWEEAVDAEETEEQPRLVRVQVRGAGDAYGDAARPDGSSTRLVLRLRGGHAIEVPSGFDADDLARLIQVVSEC